MSLVEQSSLVPGIKQQKGPNIPTMTNDKDYGNLLHSFESAGEPLRSALQKNILYHDKTIPEEHGELKAKD